MSGNGAESNVTPIEEGRRRNEKPEEGRIDTELVSDVRKALDIIGFREVVPLICGALLDAGMSPREVTNFMVDRLMDGLKIAIGQPRL